jgi:hypothetical protein
MTESDDRYRVEARLEAGRPLVTWSHAKCESPSQKLPGCLGRAQKHQQRRKELATESRRHMGGLQLPVQGTLRLQPGAAFLS